MSLMSALGCVARTVLVRGSSTGFTPPPRGAPRRASRRRTAAPPMVPGGGLGGGAVEAAGGAGPGEALGTAAGAGSAGTGSAEAGSAGAGSAAAGSAGAGPAEAGTAGSGAASPSFPGAAGKPCCPGAEEATSAPALPVIVTSPATCAPVIRQEPILSAAAWPHALVSRRGTGVAATGTPADAAVSGARARGAEVRSNNEQRPQIPRRQPVPAGQERELQDDRYPGDLRPGAAHQVSGRLGRAAGGQHVVHDEHALTGREGVLVHLDRGGPVLELVGPRVGRAGQPPLL